MTRKPLTNPETNHSMQGHPPTRNLPCLRPVGPVPADRDRDWMPLKDAIGLLSPHVGGPKASAGWILRHVTSGEVAITCRLLTYRKHGEGLAECERHEWPGAGARLAEQIEKAVLQPLSGFTALPGTADLEWLDVTGDYPVDTSMSFPHVDRAALLSFFPSLQEQSPSQPAALAKVTESLIPPSPEQSFTDFVRACVVEEPAWTKAYHERMKPAQKAGRFAGKSRAQFQREYAKYIPNPKSGRKAGG